MAMCNKRFIHSSSISLQRFATLPSTTLHFHSFHHLFCTAQQEYSLIPYCKTNPLLSVSWLLLCQRYNVFCVEIIYKKRNHTQAKAPSTSALFATFHSVIHLLFPYATSIWYALFFLRHIAPIQRTKDISFFE